MPIPPFLVDARRPPWDLGKPAIVRKPFDWSGKRYEIGDTFPWRELGCTERLLQTLWQQRHFDFGSIPPELMPAKSSSTTTSTKTGKAARAAG